MKENKWKSIWENKDLNGVDPDRDEFDVFCDLKRADGFDVSVHDEKAYFKAFYQEWLDMYRRINEITEGSISSVYEVGCGSGVNLYLFKNRLEGVKLGGMDYSHNLISVAGNIIHGADLVCDEAINLDTRAKYDLVMADSVFQYFSDIQYAEKVLDKMIRKSGKIVYLSELHDMELYDAWLEYRRKSMENYDQVYQGLDKTFFCKKWILDIAGRYGKQVVFTRSNNSEYWNSRYIFNCYIY